MTTTGNDGGIVFSSFFMTSIFCGPSDVKYVQPDIRCVNFETEKVPADCPGRVYQRYSLLLSESNRRVLSINSDLPNDHGTPAA